MVNCQIGELVEGADLYSLMSQHKRLDESICRNLFRQILEGILAIHDTCIAHGDIKLENIMLNKNGQCKIIDFGLAFETSPGQTHSSQSGTVDYMSPEKIFRMEYDAKK